MLRKISLTIVAVLALGGAAQAQPTQLRYVPSSCSVSMAEFNTWFVSGQMSKDGVVTFANSVGFPTNNTVCDFYKWAHQMFLWIVSPVSGGLVLESPVFYDVIFNAQGQGAFMPNTLNQVRNHSFALRGTKSEQIQPSGQAGGGDMLLSLNGSLVYFGVHANDVFAWFNTAMINNAPGFPATTPFPTTQAQLANVVTYAAQKGASLPDANALTMELKSAWVDAATVPNLQNYVTITATVPNYVGVQGASRWTISTTQPTVTKTLALVGLHVVGPVQGHPELVWATFEHRSNAPDNLFYFQFSPNQPIGPINVPVPYNSSGVWSFMTNGGSQQGANVSQAKIDSSGNVVANKTPPGIVPNNTFRVNPWGNAPTQASAPNNTQLLSLNIDIRTMLNSIGDVRQNYFQVGAVWTRNGSIPTSGNDTANQVGSLLLANSTMETYHQTDKKGCFGCHFNQTGNAPTGTSHLFSLQNIPLAR